MPKTSQENLDKEVADALERLDKGSGATPLPVSPQTAPMSAEEVLALGEQILIGDRVYRLARPLMVDEPKIGLYLDGIPKPLTMHAAATVRNGGKFDAEASVRFLNEVNEAQAKLSPDAIVKRIVDAINKQRIVDCKEPVPYPDGVEINTGDLLPQLNSAAIGLTFISEMRFTSEEAQNAVDLVHYSLLRRQPELPREEIEERLDVSTFMRFLVRLYTMNDMLLTSF